MEARNIKAVGLIDIRTGFQMGNMNLFKHLWLDEHQQIIVTAYISLNIGKALTAMICLLELIILDMLHTTSTIPHMCTDTTSTITHLQTISTITHSITHLYTSSTITHSSILS